MPHIIVIIDAIEALESKMSDPPTTAQTNLMNALNTADEWWHEHEEQTEVTDLIEAWANSVKGYVTYTNPPADNRLQDYADDLNQIIP